jgi:hypothetical protein
MNRYRNYVLMAAGFAVLAMVVGVFSAVPAIAQAVRAALVSNADDPGRIPYARQVTCDFNGNDRCLVQLSPVPNGKRLVITHVSGQVVESLPVGTFLSPAVLGGFGAGAVAELRLAPTYIGNFSGFNYFVFDQSELLFIDSGQSPYVSTVLGGIPSAISSASFFLSGYMLDCSNGPCASVAQ